MNTTERAYYTEAIASQSDLVRIARRASASIVPATGCRMSVSAEMRALSSIIKEAVSAGLSTTLAFKATTR
jgi:hypothetical protein